MYRINKFVIVIFLAECKNVIKVKQLGKNEIIAAVYQRIKDLKRCTKKSMEGCYCHFPLFIFYIPMSLLRLCQDLVICPEGT